MEDLAPIFRRVAEINPVPDETDLPANAMATTTLLGVVDERSGTMQTQQAPTKQTGGSKHRLSGAFAALAAFAVIVVIGGVIAFMGNQAEEPSFATAAQPTTAITGDAILASDVVSRFNPNSMEDTIKADAQLIVDRNAYDSNLPERLDIVLYADKRESDLTSPPEIMTRVIGLPGDTVEARDGNLYVNDRVLDEPYLKNPQIPMLPFGPVTLGADELWLMGDNRQTSGDSEFSGGIPVSSLRGKVTHITNP
jgi:signal peptidase I